MNYQVVYDVTTQGYRDWTFVGGFLLFLAVGMGWILWHRRFPGVRRDWLHRSAPYLFTGITLFIMSVANVTIYRDYRELTRRLRTGEYQVVEGRVEEFDPMPWEGHKNESFVVDGHRYSYSDYDASPGFNSTSSHGGPIREGLRVRIADVDGVIARLEIAR
jgi:hypothetical protein